MRLSQRKKKKTIISMIFFISLVVLGSSIYFILRNDPTCFDGIKNQNETGVDCGGICRPCDIEEKPVALEIENVELVHDVDNKYDVVVSVDNPNEVFGATGIGLELIFSNDEENEGIKRNEGGGYILPKEQKSFLFQGLVFESSPTFVGAQIKEIEWEKFAQYEEPRITVLNQSYIENPEGFGYSKITGTLVNKSDTDFENIKVKAILRNSKGELLAVNHHIMNTMRSGEQRNFTMIFPHEFPGSVADLNIEAETNVFDSDNYIRIHGEPERWEPEESRILY